MLPVKYEAARQLNAPLETFYHGCFAACSSAYREPSFGHGFVDFINGTHAQWFWNRNQVTKTLLLCTLPCLNTLLHAQRTMSAMCISLKTCKGC